MTSIYVGGSFDLFHYGHVNLLKRAKTLADRVLVAVNSDGFHESYRHERAVMRDDERLAVVESCRYVDEAFIMHSHWAQRGVIACLRPTYILHGDDWTGDSLLKQLGLDEDFLKEYGITMRYVPYTATISSSHIRQRLHA